VQEHIYLCLLPASCWFLACITLQSWRCRRPLLPKWPLAFKGLHDVIYQTIEVFITTAVRTSDPTNLPVRLIVYLSPFIYFSPFSFFLHFFLFIRVSLSFICLDLSLSIFHVLLFGNQKFSAVLFLFIYLFHVFIICSFILSSLSSIRVRLL
jgi:hypothetical protein